MANTYTFTDETKSKIERQQIMLNRILLRKPLNMKAVQQAQDLEFEMTKDIFFEYYYKPQIFNTLTEKRLRETIETLKKSLDYVVREQTLDKETLQMVDLLEGWRDRNVMLYNMLRPSVSSASA